ncbi:MAG: response regulator, partial [Anaeroplasmataceae bacterium]|nr:response regulator [Anaeroplasmataceae bacterium]
MAKIIMADDNKELLTMISEFLKMQPNMDVAGTFTGGKDLLSYLESNTADVLLLDVFMPDLDGVNTLNEIKNNARYNRPNKIIVISAFTTETIMAKASALGADYFIVKPIDL